MPGFTRRFIFKHLIRCVSRCDEALRRKYRVQHRLQLFGIRTLFLLRWHAGKVQLERFESNALQIGLKRHVNAHISPLRCRLPPSTPPPLSAVSHPSPIRPRRPLLRSARSRAIAAPDLRRPEYRFVSGHGFSRAIKVEAMRASAPGIVFGDIVSGFSDRWLDQSTNISRQRPTKIALDAIVLSSPVEIIQKCFHFPRLSCVQVAKTSINLMLHFIEGHQVLDAFGFGTDRIPRTSGDGKVRAQVNQPPPLLFAV